MSTSTSPRFSDENTAREHLEALRWPQGPFCPHCGSFDATRMEGKKHRKGAVQCNNCRMQFSVTVGTVLERSKVPLHKWLLCNHLLIASKMGMSVREIHILLGVTSKTAGLMCRRLREATKTDTAASSPHVGADALVEANERFAGSKAKNRALRDPASK